jgi:hypothetical protein
MLDYKYFIQKEELSLHDLTKLEEIEAIINPYMNSLLANKIFNELFTMDIPVDEFTSEEPFMPEEINLDDFTQNFIEVIKGNNIVQILESIKQANSISKTRNKLLSDSLSETLALDQITDLLIKRDVDLKVISLFNIQVQILTLFTNLLLHDYTDIRKFITDRVLNAFITILNINNDKLALAVLTTTTLIVYRILYIDKLSQKSEQLKQLCKRLYNIFVIQFPVLSHFLQKFAYLGGLNEFNDFDRSSHFMMTFNLNAINFRFLDYYEILLRYNISARDQIRIIGKVQCFIHSSNPNLMTRSCNIIIDCMRTNSQLREVLLRRKVFETLVTTLQELQANNLLLSLISVFLDSYGGDENFISTHEKLFDYNFDYYILGETEDPDLFLGWIKTLKVYLMTADIDRIYYKSDYYKKFGLLRRVEHYDNSYSESERNEIEIVLNLLQTKKINK